jgi:hypothetical protein
MIRPVASRLIDILFLYFGRDFIAICELSYDIITFLVDLDYLFSSYREWKSRENTFPMLEIHFSLTKTRT